MIGGRGGLKTLLSLIFCIELSILQELYEPMRVCKVIYSETQFVLVLFKLCDCRAGRGRPEKYKYFHFPHQTSLSFFHNRSKTHSLLSSSLLLFSSFLLAQVKQSSYLPFLISSFIWLTFNSHTTTTTTATPHCEARPAHD